MRISGSIIAQSASQKLVSRIRESKSLSLENSSFESLFENEGRCSDIFPNSRSNLFPAILPIHARLNTVILCGWDVLDDIDFYPATNRC